MTDNKLLYRTLIGFSGYGIGVVVINQLSHEYPVRRYFLSLNTLAGSHAIASYISTMNYISNDRLYFTNDKYNTIMGTQLALILSWNLIEEYVEKSKNQAIVTGLVGSLILGTLYYFKVHRS
jgi:hypothetical protein